MGDENGPKLLVATAKNHFSHPKSGKFQIDILINNAGVCMYLSPSFPELLNSILELPSQSPRIEN